MSAARDILRHITASTDRTYIGWRPRACVIADSGLHPADARVALDEAERLGWVDVVRYDFRFAGAVEKQAAYRRTAAGDAELRRRETRGTERRVS